MKNSNAPIHGPDWHDCKLLFNPVRRLLHDVNVHLRWTEKVKTMFLNQYDIEHIARQNHTCPNVRKGVKLLAALVESVNAQSDGWAHWPAPSRASESLVQLLQSTGNLNYGSRGTITDAQLKAAVAPIRRMVTCQKKKQAQHGNKFDFDVSAALG
jgi:hypothetical protein